MIKRHSTVAKQTWQREPAKQTHPYCETAEVRGQLSQRSKKKEKGEKNEEMAQMTEVRLDKGKVAEETEEIKENQEERGNGRSIVLLIKIIILFIL